MITIDNSMARSHRCVNDLEPEIHRRRSPLVSIGFVLITILFVPAFVGMAKSGPPIPYVVLDGGQCSGTVVEHKNSTYMKVACSYRAQSENGDVRSFSASHTIAPGSIVCGRNSPFSDAFEFPAYCGSLPFNPNDGIHSSLVVEVKK